MTARQRHRIDRRRHVDVTERTVAELAAVEVCERELKIGFNIQQALLMADVPSQLHVALISTHVEPSQGLHGDLDVHLDRR
jgi:hypothetical protein